MKFRFGAVLFCLLVCLTPNMVSAMELDAKSYALGGAYTAIVDDASAIYWNPARISKIRWASALLSGGVKSDDVQGLIDTVDKIQNSEAPDSISVTGEFVGLGAFSTRWVGVGGYGNVALKAFGEVDSGEEASGYSLGGVASGRANGVLAVAKRFKAVDAGIALKKVKKATYSISEFQSGEESVNQRNEAFGEGYALDVGLNSSFLDDRLAVGLVFRDLFSKMNYENREFKNDVLASQWKSKDSFEPIVCVGAGFKPGFALTLSGDIDTSGNFRAGVEKNLFWNGVSLRTGINKSRESSELRTGLGVNLLWFHADLGIGKDFSKDSSLGLVLNASINF